MRGRCEKTSHPIPLALAISSSLSDLDDCERCPIAEVVEHRDLLERIFAEYRCLKRLGVRNDPTIDVEYLVALDIEIAAIDRREDERRRRDQKAKEMRSRCRA